MNGNNHIQKLSNAATRLAKHWIKLWLKQIINIIIWMFIVYTTVFCSDFFAVVMNIINGFVVWIVIRKKVLRSNCYKTEKFTRQICINAMITLCLTLQMEWLNGFNIKRSNLHRHELRRASERNSICVVNAGNRILLSLAGCPAEILITFILRLNSCFRIYFEVERIGKCREKGKNREMKGNSNRNGNC